MQLAQIFSCALFCDLSADPFPAAAPAPPAEAKKAMLDMGATFKV